MCPSGAHFNSSSTNSGGNVFVDLGFDEAEVNVMALRVELMMQLRTKVSKAGLTQAQAAKRFWVSQPRISALLKGVWKDFSMDALLGGWACSRV